MKKQTIITACTFAAMTMATPAVFAVQPFVEPRPVLGFVIAERLLGDLKSGFSVKRFERCVNVQNKRILLVQMDINLFGEIQPVRRIFDGFDKGGGV